jgi:hypothetical protein
MFTSLDLLVVLFMALAATALLAVSLMFLLRNKTVNRIFLYAVSAFGVYMAGVGIYIGGGMFPVQMAVGVIAALVSIGSVVLERVRKRSDKAFLIARIASAAALVVSLLNAAL